MLELLFAYYLENTYSLLRVGCDAVVFLEIFVLLLSFSVIISMSDIVVFSLLLLLLSLSLTTIRRVIFIVIWCMAIGDLSQPVR